MSATGKQIRDLAAAMAAQCQAIADGTLTGPAHSQAQIILRNAEMLAAWVPDDRSGMPDPAISERLEYLRGELQAERISYGELAELQALAPHIEPGDVELLEWAGVPEFPEDEEDPGPQLPEEGSDEYFEWARRAPSMEIPGNSEDEDEESPGPHEYDGYITLDGRDRPHWGYYVRLEGIDYGGPFPSEYIATYVLAKAMARTGSFPAAWAEGEHGPSTRSIDDQVRKYHDAGGDALLPLPGVEYEPGDLVANDGWPSRVDGDYGDLGVMVHADGDPSVTALAHHETLTRIKDEN